MKILVLADQKSKYLYDFYEADKLKDVDLIISCGDLPPEYLSFFVTLCNVPLLYVRGNHDGKYEKTPPEGCICIEDDIYVYQGIRILGLGGSMEYLPRAANQYSETKMRKRLWKLQYNRATWKAGKSGVQGYLWDPGLVAPVLPVLTRWKQKDR